MKLLINKNLSSMIKYNRFNIFLREHYLTFLFLIILSPIFISLDFSQGLRFDQFYGHLKHKYPSIPISVLIISVLSICNLRGLLCNRRIQILSFLLFVHICLNLYFGIMRAVTVGFGMMFIIVAYYTFLQMLNKRNTYKYFYFALSLLIISKMLFDYYHHFQPLVLQLNTDGNLINNYFYGHKLYKTQLMSPFLINKNLYIYNFYDYFPFIYYLATVLSIHNFLQKKYLILSVIVLIVSNIVIIDTGSRLFIYSIYLIPFLYILDKFAKLSLENYFYLFLFASIAITLVVSFLDLNLSDQGLLSRYNHIHNYFGNFSLVNFIFPFLNEHRIETSGSLHNELLEIFSFFGFVIVYYLFLLKQIFCNIKTEFKFISYLLIFVLIIGTLIQINISNPYVGIITGLIFAVISSGPSKIRQ